MCGHLYTSVHIGCGSQLSFLNSFIRPLWICCWACCVAFFFATDWISTLYLGTVVVPVTVTGIAISPSELVTLPRPSVPMSCCAFAADRMVCSLKLRD